MKSKEEMIEEVNKKLDGPTQLENSTKFAVDIWNEQVRIWNYFYENQKKP